MWAGCMVPNSNHCGACKKPAHARSGAGCSEGKAAPSASSCLQCAPCFKVETGYHLPRRCHWAGAPLPCAPLWPTLSASPLFLQESGNNEVLFMSLDLASLDSVRAFAETFLRSEPRLDILINNAGVGAGGRKKDGFNLVFQVNHLGHFLLTHLLLERLKLSAPSRVVIVASSAHRLGKIDFENLHKPVEGILQNIQAYCTSKLANILYARELANKLEGTDVTCYAVHPGECGSSLSLGMHLPNPTQVPGGYRSEPRYSRREVQSSPV
uniref:Dehydrogenase/reductase 13 n=1 Tax=Terrapene triunguis TaxID=2587831 RepID=A0A674JTW6_9SAUR